MLAVWNAVVAAPWTVIPAFAFLAAIIFFAIMAARLPRRRSERVEALMRRPEDLLEMNSTEVEETLSEVWRNLTYSGEEAGDPVQAGNSSDPAPNLTGNDTNERAQ